MVQIVSNLLNLGGTTYQAWLLTDGGSRCHEANLHLFPALRIGGPCGPFGLDWFSVNQKQLVLYIEPNLSRQLFTKPFGP